MGIAYPSDSLSVVVTLGGEVANEHFGRSMAGAGDVNGDGFADFLVGDARYGWLPGERRCHLYCGGSSIDTIPDLVIYQPEADTLAPHPDDDAHFGEVVSGACDVNGDGLDDVLITSPEWFWQTGKMYLYHGSYPFELYPDVCISGFGSSWMSNFWATGLRGRLVKDVNGDGYDELVCLVEHLHSDGGAYVYFGGASIDSVHDLGLQGPGYPNLELGSDIDDGDLNGDGYGDLVVGAYAVENHPEWQNAAWIYFGGPDTDEIADVQLVPSQLAYEYAVCVPGDMNGDGYDDVAVAQVRRIYGGETEYSRGYVYLGGPRMDSVADLSFMGQVPWGSFSLAGGDINNDGFADLIVSESPWYPSVDEGRLGVYFGGADMDTMPDIEIYGPRGFGETVIWIGDMTGDGWPEFAVSNPSGAGEIYIYTMGEVSGEGPSSGLPNAELLRIVPNPSRGPTMIGFDGDGMSGATVGVYDLGGRLVHMLGSASQRNEASWMLWDGTNSSGQAVPAGTYVIRVQTQDRIMSGNVVVNR